MTAPARPGGGTRLLIGNDLTEEARNGDGWVRWGVQRLLWFARDGDVVVLPVDPDPDFLRHATALTGTDCATLRVVVPPPGPPGSEPGLLTADRLAHEGFRTALRRALGGRAVRRVVALWPDVTVAELARSLEAEHALPGHAFLRQGGGLLVNSKAVFRAVAAGAGVPLPPGTVCSAPQEAEDQIDEFFRAGRPVILKHEYLSSGTGNEIVSPVAGIRPIGARRVVRLTGRPAVRAHLAAHWDRLTSGGRRRLVAEEYVPDSTAHFAEFLITERGAELAGHGEMVSAPLATAEIIPSPGLTPAQRTRLVDGGRALCGPLKAMGYRGRLSADAIATPDGRILFTEYNGRVTGSTPIYGVIGEQVVGPDYARERVLLETVWPDGWHISSFRDAERRIEAAGLAYDRTTRTGVMLISAFDPRRRAVMYCVVAESLPAAREQQRRLGDVFSTRPAAPAAARHT
uniref:Amino acid ligase n=1 Tax=Streptomyces roseoverticillatus TaxID=66429 RepID=A0A0S3TVZ6_9ACTN|nr:amino acid ligase [Streptomyces roseoverticillatus]